MLSLVKTGNSSQNSPGDDLDTKFNIDEQDKEISGTGADLGCPVAFETLGANQGDITDPINLELSPAGSGASKASVSGKKDSGAPEMYVEKFLSTIPKARHAMPWIQAF